MQRCRYFIVDYCQNDEVILTYNKDRVLNSKLLEPCGIVARIAYLIHDIHGIRTVGKNRLVERYRLDNRLESEHNVLSRNSHTARYFIHARLTVLLGSQLFLYLHGFIGGITHRTRNAHAVVVAKVPSELSENHRHSVGAELNVKLRVKIVYRLYKTYYSNLKKIVKLFAAIAESVNNA